ncbi:MAG: M20/M25/M40 family metallo-hydrolase [Chitinophagaceae bacterium]|nr:M20/M25/M40 family metallo-hydrolase [Chitinophagaceae bacterium]
MNRFLFFFIVFPGFICLHAQSNELVSGMMLKNHIEALSHDSMKGRFTWRNEIKLAAGYIASQMDEIGLKSITGEDAHYDHIGTNTSQKAIPFGAVKKFVKGDSIYNGANDNASGVAAMLELARMFSKSQPSYTLMFVAFSGEELGLLGSADFLSNLKLSNVKMNVNLEMLGRPLGAGPFVVEEEGSNYFQSLLNKNLKASSNGFPEGYFKTDPYPQQGLFLRSDHYSFYKKGVAAFTIMATDPEDKFYHSADDEVETIQFGLMAPIVQAIYDALLPVVMGED